MWSLQLMYSEVITASYSGYVSMFVDTIDENCQNKLSLVQNTLMKCQKYVIQNATSENKKIYYYCRIYTKAYIHR